MIFWSSPPRPASSVRELEGLSVGWSSVSKPVISGTRSSFCAMMFWVAVISTLVAYSLWNCMMSVVLTLPWIVTSPKMSTGTCLAALRPMRT